MATEPAPGVEYPAEISQQVALVSGRIPWYGGKFGEVDDDENKHKDDEASDDGIPGIIYDEYRHYFCLLSLFNTMDVQ